jgi:hypothetical protein
VFVCGDCDVIHYRCTITLMAEVVAAMFAHVPVIGLRFSMLLLVSNITVIKCHILVFCVARIEQPML